MDRVRSPLNAVTLPVLDSRIDERARKTHAEHADFPCRAGCDTCCRSLPHLPTITRAEWERLHEALTRLDEPAQEDIRRRLREEEARTMGKTVCPILDLESGHCRTYHARPIACRTYGYYVERDGGLHCDLVTRFAEDHPVVWGNGEGIAQDMRDFGETATIGEWMRAGRGTDG